MENLSSSLYFLAHVLLLLLIPFLLLSLQFRRKDQPRLPPGPWRLPVIGSLHHVVKTPLIHRALADLARRHDAPVMYLRLGELPAVVVSSPDAAREVMKTHDVTFATRPLSTTLRATVAGGLGVAFSPYGERWRQLRKFITLELLSAKRVRSFRPIREDEAARFVGGIAAACPAGEPVNVTARVANLVADSALRAMIGERFGRREELLKCVAQAVKIGSGFNACDLFPSSRLVCAIDGTVRKARAFTRKTFELVDYAIEQHRERRSGASATDVAEDEDLLGVLLRTQEEGGFGCPLDVGDIKAILAELFLAGSESTSTTIIWAMAELMRNPSVMKRAQTELGCALQDKSTVTEDDLVNLPYIKLIIKETLRLHTPGPLLLPRECQESCEILGYDVLKGTIVLVNAWAICRDPKYWDEPEVFKPHRFEECTTDFMGTDFCYTPFGAGRRICPGLAFALANLELVLAVLLFHFDWQLPSGVIPSELDMEEEVGISVRRKRDLFLHPTLRVPL
ncbi:hypothetical protein SETIT_4G203000v2 [Setaria italica]|uniref:Cytochrome P450 n=2 Tax=Setaria italica TaxID=4555 RepID=A0A368QWL2_SETIT|nr:cytochrome P450 71D7 [Setaria italica]RCV22213.1 hypothetical protein SETIT_4G203000v2 [Setaria italica]RCV22214.1 hypothetical protein SETIT_4G203000v2 [Setaria italica]